MNTHKPHNIEIEKLATILTTLMLSIGAFPVQAELPSEGPRLVSVHKL